MHFPLISVISIFPLLFLNAFPHLLEGVSKVKQVPLLDDETLNRAISMKKRVIMVDNGGVLKSAKKLDEKEAEAESEQIKSLLGRLVADKRNTVWVITARTLKSIKGAYGDIKGLHLAGEMGTHVETEELFFNDLDYMSTEIKPISKELNAMLAPLNTQIEEYGDTQIKTMEADTLKNSIILHYKGVPESLKNTALDEAEKIVAGYAGYKVIDRPYPHKAFASISHEDCNKGTLTRLLLKHYQDTDTLFFSAGDNIVDEKMFQALMEAEKAEIAKSNLYLPIVVDDSEAERDTFAQRKLKDNKEVLGFLDKLARPNRNSHSTQPWST